MIEKYKGEVELEAEGQKVCLKFGIIQQTINCELEGLKDDKDGLKECAERLKSESPSSTLKFFYSAHRSYALLHKTPELSYHEFAAWFEFINVGDISKSLGVASLRPEDPNHPAPRTEGQ